MTVRLAIGCLPASVMFPSSEVTEVFLILAENMPGHKKMPELLAYFEHTYACIRNRRRPGRSDITVPPSFQ